MRKSQRAFSEEPGLSVLMATSMSWTNCGGTFSRPRHTSPNSPPPSKGRGGGGEFNIIFFSLKRKQFFTHTDDRLDRDVAGVDFARKLANRLVRILVGVRIDVAAAGAEQRCGHWKMISNTRTIVVGTEAYGVCVNVRLCVVLCVRLCVKRSNRKTKQNTTHEDYSRSEPASQKA